MSTPHTCLASGLLLVLLSAGCAGTAEHATDEAAPEPSTDLATPATAPDAIVGVTWEWLDFTTPVEKVVVAAPEHYTVQFGGDGRIAVRADCNRGTGTVAYLPDRRFELKPIALTRAMCPPDSQSDRFVKELGRATSYFIRDGDLYLELPMDSGALRFRRGYATPNPTQPQVEPPPG